MTLILSILGHETGLFSCSDILLSRADPEPSRLPLPLHCDPIVHTGGDHSLIGFAQKMTLVSPTVMILWSGSYAVARLLVQRIRNEAKNIGILLDLQGIVDQAGLGVEELSQISLLVHQISDGRIHIDSLNAQNGFVAGLPAVWDGSGSYDFLEDTVIKLPAEHPSWQEQLRSLLVRVMSSLLHEAVFKSNYDYLYGGWFELIINRTLGLRKIPYAVKFWGRRGDELGYDAPLFFNWYKGKSLFVCSLDQHSGSSTIRIIEVPDLLSNRRWRVLRVKPTCKPEFTFHVVMDENRGHFEIFVSDRHSAGHIEVNVSKRGSYRMEVRREFLDLIMSRNAKPDYIASKTSDIGP